jgi:hypothetical protein
MLSAAYQQQMGAAHVEFDLNHEFDDGLRIMAILFERIFMARERLTNGPP